MNALAVTFFSALVMQAISTSSVEAGPRNTFPGRRVGGGGALRPEETRDS